MVIFCLFCFTSDVGSLVAEDPSLWPQLPVSGQQSMLDKQYGWELNLSLGARFSIEWMGKWGMLWDELLPLVLHEHEEQAPAVLVMHLGGNDLMLTDNASQSELDGLDGEGLEGHCRDCLVDFHPTAVVESGLKLQRHRLGKKGE